MLSVASLSHKCVRILSTHFVNMHPLFSSNNYQADKLGVVMPPLRMDSQVKVLFVLTHLYHHTIG